MSKINTFSGDRTHPTMFTILCYLYWMHGVLYHSPLSVSQVIKLHNLKVTKFSDKNFEWILTLDKPLTIVQSEKLCKGLIKLKNNRQKQSRKSKNNHKIF